MTNYVEGFRFFDGYEDVFIESGHYLYACAEAVGHPWEVACNEWHPMPPTGRFRMPEDCEEWTRYDASGADAAYLLALEPAPIDVAAEIIALEYRRAVSLMCPEMGGEALRDILECKREEILEDCR